jgi:hypothetical protein
LDTLARSDEIKSSWYDLLKQSKKLAKEKGLSRNIEKLITNREGDRLSEPALPISAVQKWLDVAPSGDYKKQGDNELFHWRIEQSNRYDCLGKTRWLISWKYKTCPSGFLNGAVEALSVL